MPAAVAWLLLAVTAETAGTACLYWSQQLTRPVPALGAALGFAVAFWCASHALRVLPLAVACATWSGLGLAADAALGWFVLGQRLGWGAGSGLAMVGAGVAVLHLAAAPPPGP